MILRYLFLPILLSACGSSQVAQVQLDGRRGGTDGSAGSVEAGLNADGATLPLDVLRAADGELRPELDSAEVKIDHLIKPKQDSTATCTVGAACDDGKPGTTGDHYAAGCTCVGTYPVCRKNSCQTSYYNAGGYCMYKNVIGTCYYADADICYNNGDHRPDNPCIECIGATATGGGQFLHTCCTTGASCDDGKPGTTGDHYDLTCKCIGTYPACTKWSGVSCWTYAYDANGNCEYHVKHDWCYIDSICYGLDAAKPGDPCYKCRPTTTLWGTTVWTKVC